MPENRLPIRPLLLAARPMPPILLAFPILGMLTPPIYNNTQPVVEVVELVDVVVLELVVEVVVVVEHSG